MPDRLFRTVIDASTGESRTIYLDEELTPEALAERIRKSQEEEAANQIRQGRIVKHAEMMAWLETEFDRRNQPPAGNPR